MHKHSENVVQCNSQMALIKQEYSISLFIIILHVIIICSFSLKALGGADAGMHVGIRNENAFCIYTLCS